MSSEAKKKRGVAGKSNAESAPFRLNGRPPDWMARQAGATTAPVAASGGSTTMRGILGGVLAATLGFAMIGDYERLMTHAQARCTHPYLVAAPLDVEPIEETQEAA